MNSYETLSEYYDRFTDDVGYEEWADFFERLFEKEGVKPELVLDLACGTGSLTRILAQRGYDMIGADASPEMLMQALQNTLDCEPRPLLLNQRMEELDLYGRGRRVPVLSGQRKLRHRAGSTADRVRARTHVPQSGRPVRIRHQYA